jgi:hypothetical protein
METKKRRTNRLSILLFAIGVILGIVLISINTWGDLEAGLFDSLIQAEEGIQSLNCPAMMTTSEISTVSASFTNTHVRSVERRIRVHISSGNATMMREELAQLPLTPGKTEKLQWVVSPEDAAYNDKFILVRVYMFPKAPLSAQDGSCGILVVNIPYFTGNQILTSAYVASILSLVIGTALWTNNNKPLQTKQENIFRAMILLVGIIVVGMVVSHLGWWMLGVVSLALTIILLFTIPSQVMMRKNTFSNNR